MPQRDDATAAIERIYRTEYGRVVASLVRRFGDIDIAEEAAGEALLASVERWPGTGPAQPGRLAHHDRGPPRDRPDPPRVRPAAAAGPQRRSPGGVRRRDRGHRQPRGARLSPTEAWQSGAMSHQQPKPLRLPDAASTDGWLRHRFPAQLDDARELAEELRTSPPDDDPRGAPAAGTRSPC